MIEIIKEKNNLIYMNYVVNVDDHSIIQILKAKYRFSTNYIKYLKTHNKILLNNEMVNISHSINIGDCISIILSNDEQSDNIVPTPMELDILYEDDFLLVVNKPFGMPIHPSMNHFTDSLSNGIKNYFLQKNLNYKIHPITRLDKDTSGIVIFAKFPFIQEQLSIQMKNNKFIKKYIAFVQGKFSPESGIIDLPIVRKADSIIERVVDETQTQAKHQSISLYKTLQYDEKLNYSEVEFQLVTGKTHQIRVHSSHLGHPLIGDTLYGIPSDLISRQALHCYYIEFIHPIYNNILRIKTQLPEDMKNLIIQK